MTVHCIPVGGKEPLHYASKRCWCHPIDIDGSMTHNAKDLREARERHGNGREDEKWALILEDEVPAKATK